MELKGPRSERAFSMAFAGESRACNRYTFFYGQGRNDGYQWIGYVC